MLQVGRISLAQALKRLWKHLDELIITATHIYNLQKAAYNIILKEVLKNIVDKHFQHCIDMGLNNTPAKGIDAAD